jgi:hypothetical protein
MQSLLPTSQARVMTGRPTEAQCQRTIIEAAKVLGWRIHHTRPAQTGKGWRTPIAGHVGFVDLVLVHPRGGLMLAVECKRAPNTVEPGQQVWLDLLDTIAGIDARVVWVPEGLQDFLAELADLTTRSPA